MPQETKQPTTPRQAKAAARKLARMFCERGRFGGNCYEQALPVFEASELRMFEERKAQARTVAKVISFSEYRNARFADRLAQGMKERLGVNMSEEDKGRIRAILALADKGGKHG